MIQLRLLLPLAFLVIPGMALAKKDAITPEALWMTPHPIVCQREGVIANLIVRARDEGLDQKDAIERVRSMTSAFPEHGYELAPDIYRHKELNREDFDRYVMFSCHAREYSLPALPLDTVAEELRMCGAKSGRDDCVVELRNIITGAPREFRPPSHRAPPAAPPAAPQNR